MTCVRKLPRNIMLCSYRCGHQALALLYQVVLELRELEPNVISDFIQQALVKGVHNQEEVSSSLKLEELFEVHLESYNGVQCEDIEFIEHTENHQIVLVDVKVSPA